MAPDIQFTYGWEAVKPTVRGWKPDYVHDALARSRQADEAYQELTDIEPIPWDLLRKAEAEMDKAYSDYHAACERWHNENMS